MLSASLTTVISLLKTLVSFDTTSRNSNLALIRYIETYLNDCGARTELLFSGDKTKASLLAVIGPDAKGGMVLSGHTDVVPVDGQDWDTQPFTLIQKNGRLYGRGTADMKGFLAVILALVPEWAALPLKKPLYLAFSYDEEIGCLGAPALAKAIEMKATFPDIAIIGEPTEMRVINRHKSVHTFQMTVTGHEAHSSAVEKGVNAIALAAKIIGFIGQLQDEYRQNAAHHPGNTHFDPPYTTLQVGVVHGGTAHNILAKQCSFEWEIRSLPGEDTDALIRRVEAYATDLISTVKEKFPAVMVTNTPHSAVPGLKANADSSSETLLMSLIGTNQVEAVSFATEAGIFQAHAIPAIVCGPGNILQAHKPNEYIEVTQLEACMALLRKLASSVCGG